MPVRFDPLQIQRRGRRAVLTAMAALTASTALSIQPATVPVALVALGGLWTSMAAHGAPSAQARADVESLLDAVDRSGCEFERNGTWHAAHDAQMHLRDKYQYLLIRSPIDTPEQFIDQVATRSSLTGTPYRVRCGSTPPTSSHQWLLDELARLRAHR
jgi:hypothetical protein